MIGGKGYIELKAGIGHSGFRVGIDGLSFVMSPEADNFVGLCFLNDLVHQAVPQIDSS